MKYSRFTIFIISGLVMGLGLFAIGRLAWGGSNDNIRKWSWNAIVSSDTMRYPNPIGLGWLSMNCRNDFDNDGVIDDRCKNAGGNNVSYGLKVNLDTSGNTALGSFDGNNDYVQGCAWSATFGWVCFDRDPSYCPVNKLACGVLSDDGVKIVKDPNYPFYYLKSSIPQTATSSVINSDPETRASILNLVEEQAGRKDIFTSLCEGFVETKTSGAEHRKMHASTQTLLLRKSFCRNKSRTQELLLLHEV
jgi:hypothetical protein